MSLFTVDALTLFKRSIQTQVGQQKIPCIKFHLGEGCSESNLNRLDTATPTASRQVAPGTGDHTPKFFCIVPNWQKKKKTYVFEFVIHIRVNDIHMGNTWEDELFVQGQYLCEGNAANYIRRHDRD